MTLEDILKPPRISPRARRFQKTLLAWFDRHQRPLPWRRTSNPYRVWVSEIMLQQTQVAQVLSYYRRFVRRFPTLERLAHASLDEVLKQWEGMGYYRRADYLHRAARIIVRQYDGRIPSEYNALRPLPGFGDYTTGALLSIAFNKPYPAVDGNVTRVISRLFLIRSEITLSKTKNRIVRIAAALIPDGQASAFNQALMELGATHCTPQRPDCRRCCVRSFCEARKRLDDPSRLPKKKAKARRPHYQVAVGVIRRRGRLLITKRPSHVLLGNLWEFPGGKHQGGETMAETCRREIKEELNIAVDVGSLIVSFKHFYTHFGVTLHFFECRYLRGRLRPRASVAVKWVWPGELRRFTFPQANRKVIELLRKDGRG